MQRWLQRGTEAPDGTAVALHVALAGQLRALGAPPFALEPTPGAPPATQQPAPGAPRATPLPRLHGPPPPEHVGAKVRYRLFQQQYAAQVMRKLLVGAAERLVAERAAKRRRGSGGGDERSRRGSGSRG